MEINRQTLAEWAAASAGHIAAAPAGAEPFPHLRFRGLLPDPLFAQLRSLDLPSAALRPRPGGEDRVDRERNRYFLTVTNASFREVARTVPAAGAAYALLSRPAVGEALRQRFAADLEAEFGTADLAWQPSMMLIEDRSGYELLPHTDAAYKAVTVLLYLAGDDDDVRLGTQLFWPADGAVLQTPDIMKKRFRRHLFDRVETIDYRPNHGVAFVPSRNSFHGVGEVTGKVRRLLQYQLCVSDEVAAGRRGAANPGDAAARSRLGSS